jgi:hypothetical protein
VAGRNISIRAGFRSSAAYGRHLQKLMKVNLSVGVRAVRSAQRGMTEYLAIALLQRRRVRERSAGVTPSASGPGQLPCGPSVFEWQNNKASSGISFIKSKNGEGFQYFALSAARKASTGQARPPYLSDL